MITVQEILSRSTKYLEEKKVPKARRQAEEILSLSLKKNRIDLYMHFDQPVEENELQVIRENLSRRAKREPLQYIEGEVEFYGIRLKVQPGVLIPRQETELLVDLVAEFLKKENLYGRTLLDLCCGSGCIGLALKKRFPELKVILSDLSPQALSIAKQNAQLNDVQVDFYEGDLFEALDEPVDYLVSNPPYICSSELSSLEPEVIEYEPKISLDGGEKGLEVYKKIEKKIKNYLKPEGKAWFEMGSSQRKEVEEIFLANQNFKIEFKKDYASLDRFFFLELE